LSNTPRFFTDAKTFSSIPNNATYRPLLTLSFALDYWKAGSLDPKQFHLTQFVLLLILGFLLTLFFTMLFKRAEPHPENRVIAVGAAALFCVHTANTETMNLISSRSDIISTLGIVGSFLIFLRWPNARRFQLHLIPMVIGSLAKAPAVVYAPLLLAYMLIFEREETTEGKARGFPLNRRLAITVGPAFVTGLALLWFLSSMNAPEWTSGGGDRLSYLRTQAYVWLHYARLFILPVGLSADSDMAIISKWYDTRVIAGLLFIIILIWVTVKMAARSSSRPVAFGLAWFAIGLIPTSSFFPLAEVANEHRIFLPFIGLSLASSWWFLRRARSQSSSIDARSHPVPIDVRRWAIIAVTVAILLVHAAGARARNRVWKSEETLWRDVTEKSPQNPRGWMNYGLTQMAVGKYAAAREYFQRAEALAPNYAVLEINLGIVTDAMGDVNDAERHFLRALKLAPDSNAHFFYARWLASRARAPEAIPHLQRAITLSPAAADPRLLLMSLYAARGSERELQMVARQALAINPTEATALALTGGRMVVPVAGESYDGYFKAGLAQLAAKQYANAARAFRISLRFQPSSSDAQNNLGWSLAQLGFYPEAITALENAVRLSPSTDLFRNNLTWARSQAAQLRR